MIDAHITPPFSWKHLCQPIFHIFEFDECQNELQTHFSFEYFHPLVQNEVETRITRMPHILERELIPASCIQISHDITLLFS